MVVVCVWGGYFFYLLFIFCKSGVRGSAALIHREGIDPRRALSAARGGFQPESCRRNGGEEEKFGVPGKGLGLSPAWCAVTRSWPHRSFVWEPGPAALPGNQPEAVGMQEKVPQNPVQAAAGPSEVRALGRKPALWWLCGPPGDFCCGRVRG